MKPYIRGTLNDVYIINAPLLEVGKVYALCEFWQDNKDYSQRFLGESQAMALSNKEKIKMALNWAIHNALSSYLCYNDLSENDTLAFNNSGTRQGLKHNLEQHHTNMKLIGYRIYYLTDKKNTIKYSMRQELDDYDNVIEKKKTKHIIIEREDVGETLSMKYNPFTKKNLIAYGNESNFEVSKNLERKETDREIKLLFNIRKDKRELRKVEKQNKENALKQPTQSGFSNQEKRKIEKQNKENALKQPTQSGFSNQEKRKIVGSVSDAM